MTPFKNKLSFILVFSLVVALAACRAVDTATVSGKPIELFNHQDLGAWTTCMRTNAESAQTWTVTNGVIHLSGQPAGYLRTKHSYRDYKLTVEWRFVKVAPKLDNGGILVHIQAPDKVWPVCIQVQGKHEHQGDLFVMAGAECKEHKGQDANTAVPMHGESAEKPVGEWNTAETICSGNTVKSYINGKLMNEITECTVTNGCIGFQSEAAEMEIRKVLLEPISK